MSRITKNKKGINPRYFLEETKRYGEDQGADADRAVELAMAAIQNVLGSTVGVTRSYSDKHTGYEITLADGSAAANAHGSAGIQSRTNNPELEAEFDKMHKLFAKEMQAKKKDSGYGVQYRSVGESKQPTTKTLMEGFNRFLHETTHRDQLDEGFSVRDTFLPAIGRTDKHVTAEQYYEQMVQALDIDKFAFDRGDQTAYQIDAGGEAAAEIKKQIPKFMHKVIEPLMGKYMTANGISKLEKLYPTDNTYYNFGYNSSVGSVEDILDREYRYIAKHFQEQRKGALTDEQNLHVGDLYRNVQNAHDAGTKLMARIGSFSGMQPFSRQQQGIKLKGEQ